MENTYHFKLITEAIRFISTQYKEQPKLEDVANHVHLSKFHFQKLFQKWVGVSPKQFLQFTTIEHAKQCLIKGRSTLATAHQVGLSGNGRLHDLFIKVEACTPGAFQKRGNGLLIKYAIIDTPFGKALVAETEVGICKLSFLDNVQNPQELLTSAFPNAILEAHLGKYGKRVKQYFANWEMPDKKIVLDLKGTPFQIRVWKALLAIPSSQFLAYGDLAKNIDKPNASRAVGTAIGNNPIAYLIPCHRVIRQSGEIGAYRWGHERKVAIHGYENIRLNNQFQTNEASFPN